MSSPAERQTAGEMSSPWIRSGTCPGSEITRCRGSLSRCAADRASTRLPLARFSARSTTDHPIDTGEIMLKKLLVTLVAAAFAAGAYAQAPKDAVKPATQMEQKADSKTAKKGKAKAKAKSTKGKAKAKADEKKDSGKTSK